MKYVDNINLNEKGIQIDKNNNIHININEKGFNINIVGGSGFTEDFIKNMNNEINHNEILKEINDNFINSFKINN